MEREKRDCGKRGPLRKPETKKARHSLANKSGALSAPAYSSGTFGTGVVHLWLHNETLAAEILGRAGLGDGSYEHVSYVDLLRLQASFMGLQFALPIQHRRSRRSRRATRMRRRLNDENISSVQSLLQCSESENK